MYFYILLIFVINIITVFGAKPTVSESEDCKNVLNFFNKYLKDNKRELIIPECCNAEDKNHHLICDNKGSITEIELRFNDSIEDIDFSTFPLLQNVNDIILEGPMFKNMTLPSRLFEMPNLKSLQVLSSNITSIESVNKNCGIEKLSLFNNTIKGFPDQIINCSKLKFLDLSINKEIGKIPDSISSLKNLEYFYAGVTGLTSVSKEIFELNLKEIDLDENPNLKIEIYNFGTKLESCDFRHTDIMCYEPGTCLKFVKSIKEGDIIEYDYEDNITYGKCASSKGGKSTSTILHIMFAILAVLLLICGIVFWYIPHKKNKEKENSFYETKNNYYISPKSPKSPSFIDKPSKTRSFKVLSVTSSSATLNNNNSNNSLNNINNSFTNNSYSNSPIQSINSNNDINDNNNNNNSDNNKYIFIDVDNNTFPTNKPNNNSNVDISSAAFQSSNLLSPQLGSTNNNNNLGNGYKNALSMYYSDLFDSSQISQEYSFINQMKNES